MYIITCNTKEQKINLNKKSISSIKPLRKSNAVKLTTAQKDVLKKNNYDLINKCFWLQNADQLLNSDYNTEEEILNLIVKFISYVKEQKNNQQKENYHCLLLVKLFYFVDTYDNYSFLSSSKQSEYKLLYPKLYNIYVLLSKEGTDKMLKISNFLQTNLDTFEINLEELKIEIKNNKEEYKKLAEFISVFFYKVFTEFLTVVAESENEEEIYKEFKAKFSQEIQTFKQKKLNYNNVRTKQHFFSFLAKDADFTTFMNNSIKKIKEINADKIMNSKLETKENKSNSKLVDAFNKFIVIIKDFAKSVVNSFKKKSEISQNKIPETEISQKTEEKNQVLNKTSEIESSEKETHSEKEAHSEENTHSEEDAHAALSKKAVEEVSEEAPALQYQSH